ncbi:hypothetical protein GCM10025867_25780 [Frondihabitans sucicola]|uniref:Glutaminase n=1 Tax=Frondihabitans sucicola TaxID=1268041 RepID=A0ABM8GPY7_9MICO|nr:hypothetical protein [Frondihabitans sucicola]BDZ50337.1 hypothetical protein GCM10025867_25780 [Frondihabitans sucicola]
MADGGADPADLLRSALRATIDRLDRAEARDEALAVVKEPRGFGPFKTQTSMQPVGRAWRLGVILLDRGARLYSVGKITRATATGWPQNLSLSVEQRRADRQAASRGDFVEGDVVNYGYTEIAHDPAELGEGSDPLSFDGERLLLRWGPGPGERRPLETYLADRAQLLEDE